MARRFFKRNLKAVLLFVTVAVSFTACRQLDVYEKNVSVSNYQWKSSFVPGFDFEITDTVSAYNLYIVLRHTDAYHYNNIWLNITGVMDKDTLVSAPHVEMPLGSEDKGWEGTGMDDIWEVRKAINKKPVSFRKKGLYHFKVAQVMREDPLANVISVGMRVERIR